MKIEFDGYYIRSFSNKDVQSIARHANNPRIAANLRNGFPHPYTIDDAEKWLQYVKSKKPETNFAIATRSEAIGGIGLELMDDVHYQTAGLGYWIGEDYWGKGIMTAAVTVFTEYAFRNYDLIRIFAAIFESNRASVRVIEKAGYTFEGRLRRSVNKNGRILDELMYAKVKG
jgi:RimJ/RimL family protein N-acetyltransferase